MVRKPRLISKQAVKPDSSDRFKDIPENYFKCCRYCHSYENGRCWNKTLNRNIEPVDLEVYGVSEEGHVSAVLEEVLNDEGLVKKFMYEVMDVFIKWKISDKKRQEFMEHFRTCWSEFADFTLKEELDEAVSKVYADRLCGKREYDGIPINNPEEYCCKEWS